MSILDQLDVGESLALYDLTWQEYKQLLVEHGSHRFRHTYDRGTFEVMLPLMRHECLKTFLRRMVHATVDEWEIHVASFGSMTLWRKELQLGIEFDECYYFATEALVRCGFDLDFSVDPPPDLAVEVDIASASVNRMPVLATLGVPEVWKLDDDGQLSFWRLHQNKRYNEIDRSVTFPFFSPLDLQRFADLRFKLGDLELVRRFRDCARKKINS